MNYINSYYSTLLFYLFSNTECHFVAIILIHHPSCLLGPTVYWSWVNRSPCIKRTAGEHLFVQLFLNMFIQHFSSAKCQIQQYNRERGCKKTKTETMYVYNRDTMYTGNLFVIHVDKGLTVFNLCYTIGLNCPQFPFILKGPFS